jgi:putative component of toxin-antitoxin plasmid stabilization module
MFTIKQTVEFTCGSTGSGDGTTRRRLQTRLRKLSLGIWGDAEPSAQA